MVDHFGSHRSNSAVFWHNDKDADVLRNYWIVQKDNTVFPKCEIINSEEYTSSGEDASIAPQLWGMMAVLTLCLNLFFILIWINDWLLDGNFVSCCKYLFQIFLFLFSKYIKPSSIRSIINPLSKIWYIDINSRIILHTTSMVGSLYQINWLTWVVSPKSCW